jgi:bifunctional non-homologous end joining protein LigD
MADRTVSSSGPLSCYSAKRNFARTPEPRGVRARKAKALAFVIQKHWASRLHYDFRLELDGVLLSWAVPKGRASIRRKSAWRSTSRTTRFPTALKARSHPGSTVPEPSPWHLGIGRRSARGLTKGKLLFNLHGEKLAGLWELVRIAKPGDKQEPWFLFKKRDAWARPLAEYDVIVALPDSVVKKPLGRLEERAPRGGVAPSARTRSPQSAATLPGAVKANLPATLAPQLATLATNVPASGEWSYEIKFDGYRLLARIEQGRARLFTRNGNDWTAKLKALAAAVETLGIPGRVARRRDRRTEPGRHA